MKAIFKLELFKFIKNPWALVFGVGMPIFWIFLIGFTWGDQTVIINGQVIKVVNLSFPGLVMLINVTFSVSNLSITLCNERLEKRIKQLRLANVNEKKYLGSLFLFNYSLFFLIFLFMLIISIFLFHLSTSVNMLLSVIFLPFIFYIIHFCLAITIANNTNTSKTNMFISIVVFYVLIFLSGATIPSFLFGQWFKYLQYITPTGCAVVLLTAISNGLSTVDVWFVYLIELFYLGLFGFLSIKTFKWE